MGEIDKPGAPLPPAFLPPENQAVKLSQALRREGFYMKSDVEFLSQFAGLSAEKIAAPAPEQKTLPKLTEFQSYVLRCVDSGLSDEEMSNRLCLPKRKIRKAIEALRRNGFLKTEIEE